MPHHWVSLTRHQLYNLVWSSPIQQLAIGMGISNVALAKKCRKAFVPVPVRGYWNRLNAGMRVNRTPLPPRDLSMPHGVEVGIVYEYLFAKVKKISETPDPSEEPLTVQAERLRARLDRMKIPVRLRNPIGPC